MLQIKKQTKTKLCRLCFNFIPVTEFRLRKTGTCMPWCQTCTRKYDKIMKRLKRKEQDGKTRRHQRPRPS